VRFAFMLLLIAGLACGRPEAAPAPASIPGPKLVVHFLDKDAALPLPSRGADGSWEFMNIGAWEHLDVRWTERGGDAAVGRTAPDWLLLRDPAGEVHRLVLHGPGPGELRDREESLDRDDRDALMLLGLIWVFSWNR
jgi:hypothetical protein